MKSNILILGLQNNYTKEISKKLADNFELFFLDVNDILEYNLVNNDMLLSAGQEYFDNETKKTISSIAHYENTLIFGKIELLLQANYIDIIKQNSVVIYLKINKEKLQKMQNKYSKTQTNHTLVAFEEEDRLCCDYADITICLDDEKDVLDKIKEEIVNYFEK